MHLVVFFFNYFLKGAKMISEFDYNEYDSISLALKNEESARMLSYYSAFGWEEYERRDDFRYFDIVHVKLKRHHKIPNKDRLQLLQVKMEASVNNFADIRKNKHASSIFLAVLLVVFSLAFIALGFFLAMRKIFISMAVSFLALGVLMPFALIPIIKKISLSECRRYAEKFKEMTAVISRIVAEARNLYGEGGEAFEKK